MHWARKNFNMVTGNCSVTECRRKHLPYHDYRTDKLYNHMQTDMHYTGKLCHNGQTNKQAQASAKWAVLSEFVSSSIPSWQILTAHAQPFRGARDLAFCLKVPLDSLLVWASSGDSGETARMRRLAWTFAARLGHKYQIRLTRPKYQ